MKKLYALLACTAFAATAFAQWTAPSVSARHDFVEDAEMYLYNTKANLFFTEGNGWGTQTSLGGEALKIKVNQYVAGEQEWDGKTYTISANSVKKAGWYYVFVNSDEGDYGTAFVDRKEQPCYMWELAKQDNGTYRIWAADANPAFGHNDEGYEGGYLGSILRNGEQLTVVFPLIDAEGLLNGDVAQLDWTFVTEEEYAAYQSEYETYNAAMKLKAKIEEAVEKGVDVTAPAAVYDNANSTKEELDAAYNEVISLIAQKDEESVTPDNPVDYTYVLTNPDFENGTTGWENEAGLSTFETKNDWVKGDGFENNYLNLWGGSVIGDVSQTVANIPNGIYRVSAGVFTNAAGVYFFANDMSKEVEVTDGEHGYIVSLITQVTERTLEVGLGVGDELTHWYCLDNVKLEYIGNGTDAYMAWLKELAALTPDLDGLVAKQELIDEYVAVLEAVNNATTKEEFSVLIPKFDEASTKLQENIDAYSTLDNMNTQILNSTLATANEYYTAKLEAYSDSISDIVEYHVLDTEALNILIADVQSMIDASESNASYMENLAVKVEELNVAITETYAETAGAEVLESSKELLKEGQEMLENKGLSNEEIEEYIEKADEALHQLAIPTGEASDLNPIDYTILIVNPSFEEGTKGWTNEAGISTFGNDSYLIDNEIFVGSQYLNLWHATGLTGRVYQHLEGLRNGTYEVSAAAYSNAEGVSLFAGNAASSLDVLGVSKVLSVVVKVTDGTLDLGGFLNTAGECWCCFDNFTLTYYGENSEANPTDNNEVLTGVDAIENNNAKAEYYSLSGARLAAPAKGLNIVKKNGSTTKVLVK